MSSLKDQRAAMFLKFTKDCIKNPKFSSWFAKYDQSNTIPTRQQKPRFKPVPARTRAYQRSAIPQMVKVANSLAKENNKTRIVLNSRKVLII